MFKENKRWSVADTLIGQGTHAEGKMTCEASLRIEGEYQGDIECKADVIIGESGVVRSNIFARDITITGKVYGDVVTTGRLTIMSSGQLHGTATTSSLLVQDGGILSGSCRMEQRTQQTVTPPVATNSVADSVSGGSGQSAPLNRSAGDPAASRETREPVREGSVKERRQAG
ncbi:bactofilin family protein [Paenibacillus herberti]|uniref:Cell division protein n=1 Tax=Paenibacillus herberti TaxID=1619309 RepID=A0A229NV28_9BACL|nr:polymer-forming cytoskeletal protein [Paenibacillus herberti]OXM13732.1 hypothetical protein CGZ75_22200 [Paenibacillus herberti]